MISKYINNEGSTSPLINVIPTAAANTTYNAYIDMQSYDSCSLQVEWTAGGGGGTLSLVVYGSLQDDTTAAASVNYQDITNAVFGVAAIAGNAIAIDGDNVLGNVKHVRISATVANSDAATALYVYSRKKKNY